MKSSDLFHAKAPPRKDWWVGFLAIIAGTYLLYFFSGEPDTHFPRGRWPLYALASGIIAVGLAFLYRASTPHQNPFLKSLLFALGFTLLTAAIPVASAMAKGDASVVLSCGLFAFKTSDHMGRIISALAALFFVIFSLLAWLDTIRQFRRLPKKRHGTR